MKQEQQLKEGENQTFVGYIKDDDYYFDGYSHFSIHEQMLKDTVRTKAYMKAITLNPVLFKDKIVLDVGSGTGILSIFAAKNGAKHVYGIEKANIYKHSRNIIKQNNLEEKITIINGLVEEIELPVDKVDIIISEWMGYFLLYESMLDSVLYARDKWLREGGIMMPDKATMYVAVLDDQAYYKKKLNYWNSVYGIKMTCMKKWVLAEPIVDPINHQDILSTSSRFLDLDLQTVTTKDLDFESRFTMNIEMQGGMYGLVTWFDCQFEHGTKKISLSTSPYRKQTHWKQTVFYIEKAIEVVAGDVIEGRFRVCKAKQNHRQLNVQLSFSLNGQTQPVQYYRIS